MNVRWWHENHLGCEYVGHRKYKTHIFSDMQGKVLWLAGGTAAKNCRPLTGNNHVNYKESHQTNYFAQVLFMEHSTVSIHEAGSETMRKCMYFQNFYWLLNLLCSWRSGRCQKVSRGAKTLKEVRQNNKKNLPQNIFMWRINQKREWQQREKGRKEKEGWQREGEVDEAGSRESSNDGSDQRTTCQTLEVISCLIEDFYGILAAWLTSQGVGRDGEKDSIHPPPPFPPIFFSVQPLYPKLSYVRLNRTNTTTVSPRVCVATFSPIINIC